MGGIYYAEESGYIEGLLFEEKVGATGTLSIVAYPGDPLPPGEKHPDAVVLDLGHNLILDLGRAALASLQRHTVDGGTASGNFDLGFLALGNGSNGGLITPNASDTALNAETTGAPTGVNRKSLNVATPPPGPPFLTNLWTAQIGPQEFNQTTGSPPLNQINEAGLVCLDDTTLFSLRTFANQLKSAGITFEFRWSIAF